MSALELDLLDGTNIIGHKIGFCAYGSGAKSKVFEGVIQLGWKKITENFALFSRLKSRQAITAKQYEDLHRGYQKESIQKPTSEFVLVSIGGEGLLEGYRKYAWVQ